MLLHFLPAERDRFLTKDTSFLETVVGSDEGKEFGGSVGTGLLVIPAGDTRSCGRGKLSLSIFCFRSFCSRVSATKLHKLDLISELDGPSN